MQCQLRTACVHEIHYVLKLIETRKRGGQPLRVSIYIYLVLLTVIYINLVIKRGAKSYISQNF